MGNHIKINPNDKFGKFTVVKLNHIKNNKVKYYLCKCECGYETIISKYILVHELYTCKSCSRFKSLSKSRIYGIHQGMKTRCYNKNHSTFSNYGSRGIKVCDEWLGKNGFINFYKWSMENGYKENLTIDRINPYKNYHPSNCRWATMKEQAWSKKSVYDIINKNKK